MQGLVNMVIESKIRDSWYPTKMLLHWTERATHSNAVSLLIHGVVETKFYLICDCLHQFDKNVFWIIKENEFANVKRVGAHLYRFG